MRKVLLFLFVLVISCSSVAATDIRLNFSGSPSISCSGYSHHKILHLYSNGTFNDSYGSSGVWDVFGQTLMLQYLETSTCDFYGISLKSNYGFFYVTDDSLGSYIECTRLQRSRDIESSNTLDSDWPLFGLESGTLNSSDIISTDEELYSLLTTEGEDQRYNFPVERTLNFDWNCDGEDIGSTSITFFSYHGFETGGGVQGSWYVTNGVLRLQYTAGCEPWYLMSFGSFKGFMRCLDGSEECDPVPNCCWLSAPTAAPSTSDGGLDDAGQYVGVDVYQNGD